MISSPANPTLPTHLQTVDAFEQWERQHPHEGSYEFVRGQVIDKGGIEQKYVHVVDFLLRTFVRTDAFSAGDSLAVRCENRLSPFCSRVPDLSLLTFEQRRAIRRGERVSTLFAIELLSESETYNDILEKLQDYFDGGAQLVWYIVPKRQKIFAYTSPDESKTYKGQDVISAAPVMPEFEFVVADMFA